MDGAPDRGVYAVRPPAARSRRHGWKLHVSATPMSAPIVLARSAEVLVAHGCPFRVRSVIRHANRGGIYRTVDAHDGAPVLVKQVRPHVGALLDGTDVRDRLRDEARMLDVLAPRPSTSPCS